MCKPAASDKHHFQMCLGTSGFESCLEFMLWSLWKNLADTLFNMCATLQLCLQAHLSLVLLISFCRIVVRFYILGHGKYQQRALVSWKFCFFNFFKPMKSPFDQWQDNRLVKIDRNKCRRSNFQLSGSFDAQLYSADIWNGLGFRQYDVYSNLWLISKPVKAEFLSWDKELCCYSLKVVIFIVPMYKCTTV